MKKRFTILFGVFCALMILISMPGKAVGQSTTYTSNVTLPSVSSPLSACTVVISENSYDGIKIGTSKNPTGSFNITVPAGTTKLYVHAAAWTGKNSTLSVTTNANGVSITPNTAWSLTADSGISGTGSSYTLSTPGNASTSYFKEYTLSGVTSDITITIANGTERAVVWGINTSSGSLTQSNLAITGDPVALSFDLYNSSSAQTVSYTTLSTGAITITPASPTSYFSYVHNAAAKTITVTPIAVTPSAQTVTISQEADATYAAGSKTFTVSVANSAPLANIAALTTNTVSGTYNVTFTDAVVTYVNGKYAYIQDASGAVLYYNNDGHSLTAGNILNGTATVSYMLQNNTPEITALSGVTPTSGAAPNPTTVVASEWDYTFNNVLSQYFKITDAKITFSSNKYYVSVGSSAKAVENIQLYGRGDASSFSIDNLTNDDVFTIIGFPMLYNTTKEFQIFIVPQKAEINIDASALELPYNANNNGSIAVSYSNFEPYETTATLYSNQECTTPFSGSWIELGDLSDSYTSIPYSVEENAGNSDRTVYLKVESMNENTSVISKKFTITQIYHQTYSVTYTANEGTGNDLVVSGYEYDAPVTVKPNTGEGNPNFERTGYSFSEWNTENDGNGTSYSNPATQSASATFNITGNTTLYAQWKADAHDITTVVTPTGTGSVTYKVGDNVVTRPHTDETVTLVVAPATGYALASLSVTNDDTQETVSVENNTFTMPANDITVTATFEEVFSYNVDFESAANTYTYWVFTDMTSQGTHSEVKAHGGSYFGTTNAQNPSYITTANKIANPQSITFYVTRQTTNSTASTWAVQVSSDGSSWTTVGETQSAISMTKGNWVEVTRDLSSESYKDSYVRIYYSGSTATRDIDDIQLFYTPDRHKVTVAKNSDGTITARYGNNTITEGNCANIDSNTNVTLTAEGDATHMFSSWSVTEDESGDVVTVTNNSFTMPSCDVTVEATFVPSWTFTYNINGHTVTEKYLRNGATITLPTTSEYCPDGYSIKGWTTDESDLDHPLTSVTASQDRTLYAIFGKNVYGDFVKVKEDLTDWTGYYLIVYETGSVAFDGSRSGSALDGTPNFIEVSISSERIEHNNTTEASMFNIAKNGDYYTILSSSGYYIGRTDNSNGLDYANNIKYDHSIEYSGEIVITSSGGPTLQYYYSGNNSKFRYYRTSQQAIALYKSELTLTGSYTHVVPETITEDITLTAPTYIASGSIVNMGTHTLEIGEGGSLIIEDGGQLILRNNHPAITATVKKNISAGVPETRTAAQNWYIISSSVNAPYIKTGTNLITGTTTPNRYDLYRYDEPSATWENYKSNPAHSGFNVNQSSSALENGRGYLYRNESAMTIEFTGYVNTSASYTVTAGGPAGFDGFNLLGNPYTHEIYKGGAFPNSGTSGYELSTGFYRLNSAGGWEAGTDSETAIAPNEGILIQATKGGTITIDNTTNKTRYNNEYLQFTVANSEYEDVAYAWFDKGAGLNKINHRNAEIPMLYINQEGQDYAIATMNDDTKTFNLNFKAMTTGKYTLSYKANGEFKYLHVIDRLTGEDVDMLLEGEYSFIGSTNDSDARFIVKLGYMPNYSDAENDIFAYQNGSEILVSGEGELQIFDVTGRNVMTTTVNGAESINISTQGVYIFRLVGNEVKTQKIVVR